MMPNPAAANRPRSAAPQVFASHPLMDTMAPAVMALTAAGLWAVGLVELSHLWNIYEDRVLFCYAWFGVWILTATAVSCYRPATRMAKGLLWLLTLPLGYFALIALAGISREPLR